jgi:drug/metabolite transporter (DMT)-like permease
MSAVLALLASLVWGTSDFAGGLVSKRVRPLVVVGLAHLSTLVVLLIIATSTGAFGGRLGYLPWAIAGGVVGLIGLVAFYTALSTGSMGIVAPIAGTGAIVPVVVGLVGGDSPGVLQILGMAVAIGGVILASGPELRAATGASAGIRPLLLACVAALGFGSVFVCIERGSRYSVLMTLTFQRVTSAAIVCLIGLGYLLANRRASRQKERPRLLPSTGTQLGAIVFGGWTDAGANGLYGAASRHGLVSITAVLASLYPAVTVVLARVIEGERTKRIQDVGVGLALGGIVLLAVG